MKKVLASIFVVSLILVLSSCQPPQPTQAIFYDGDKDEVYGVALQAASTAANYNEFAGLATAPWILTTSDQSGGYFLIEATTTGIFQRRTTHSLSFVVS